MGHDPWGLGLLAQTKTPNPTVQTYFDQISRLQDQIQWNQTLVYGLCILVVVQILAKVVLFSWVQSVLRRVERLLSLVEAHGQINDSMRSQIRRGLDEVVRKADVTAQVAAQVVETTTGEMKAAVAAIPQQVVERMKNDTDSGAKIKALTDQNPGTGRTS